MTLMALVGEYSYIIVGRRWAVVRPRRFTLEIADCGICKIVDKGFQDRGKSAG